jgi:2-dehydropantoate 2-reductase
MTWSSDRIVIVGAGAMGCLFAARLALSGADVTVVDIDRERLHAIAASGITLEDDSGVRTVRVRACTAAAVCAPVDLVIMLTKTVHGAAAAQSMAQLAGPGTYALTLQNGIGNADHLANHFGAAMTLVGAAGLPADFKPPAHVVSHGDGLIWIGPVSGSDLGIAEATATRFSDAGLTTGADAHVMIRVWEKLAFNAALNALGAVTGFTNAGVDTADGRRIATAVVDETVAVARAQGLVLDRDDIVTKIMTALHQHAGHQASMLQDRIAGRPTEVEAINGAIVRAGVASGVPTPVTATLAGLVRMVTAPV